MEKVLGRFEKWSTHVAVLSIFIMMLLTTADAIGRYLFSFPLPGAYEVTEKYLMVIAVYLGASYTYRGGSTIRITLLVDRLPRGVKMGLQVFAQVFSICYGFFLMVPAVQSCSPSLRAETNLEFSSASVVAALYGYSDRALFDVSVHAS